MKLSLLGFMGSGKSSVAKVLADKLGLPVVEMDEVILKKSGRASIPELFEEFGEDHFRDLEAEVARELTQAKDAVISAGGGIISRPENVACLKLGGGVLVYLETAFETLCSRLGEDSSRPLWRDPAAARALYEKRLPLYEQCADFVVNTDGRTALEVAEYIITRLKDRSGA